MQTAVAHKPENTKSNDCDSARVNNVKHETDHVLGAAAGMPIYLKTALGSIPTIGAENDEYEREADQVAEIVMRKPESGDAGVRSIPRVNQVAQSISISEAIKRKPKSSAASTGEKSALTPTVEHAVKSNDPGFTINTGTRKKIESSIGEDLTNVRVHENSQAQQANKALNSRAFTHGSHIWLGKNESQNDVALMAHEVTHVIQQRNSNKFSNIQRKPSVDTAPGMNTESITPGLNDAHEPESSSEESTQSDASEQTLLPVTEELDHLLATENETDDSEPIEEDAESNSEVAEQQQNEADAETAETDIEEAEGEENTEAEEGGAGVAEGSGGGATEPMEPVAENESLSDLQTGELALIDLELAEHQRWGSALERVGSSESLERAEFVAEAAGGGLLGGLASGAAMGMGMGLVGRAAARFVPIPGVGGILSGAMSVYGLASRDWSASGATIGQFGEGASTYETLANSIAAIAEIIDIVSNVLGVVEGIVGIIQIGVYAITAAAGIATVLTLGAAAPLLAAAASAAETLTVISLALGVATTALDLINAGILQPAVLLFRALHAFTSEADPREIEAQGADLTQAAGAIGGAVGGAVGARGAATGGRPRTETVDAPNSSPHAEAPVSAASGDGPTVRFEAPRVDADTVPTNATGSSSSRPAILPPPNLDAAVPSIPGAPRLPEIAPTPIIPVGDTLATPSTTDSSTPAPNASSTGGTTSTGNDAPELSSMRVETIGDGDAPNITDVDIDNFIAGIETNARSDTFFELPGRNPDTGGGLQPVRPRGETPALAPDGTPLSAGSGESLQGVTRTNTTDNPDVISYHENHYFRDIGEVRIAEAADVPIGTNRTPGQSKIPTDVGTTALPVPQTRIGGGSDTPNVEVRYHSENPRAPTGSYSAENPTVQINSPNRNFRWAPTNERVRGQAGRYLLPDGTWVTMGGETTDAQRAAAHWPAGGRSGVPDTGGSGSGSGSGAPPSGGGSSLEPTRTPLPSGGAHGEQLTLPKIDMIPSPSSPGNHGSRAAIGEQLDLPFKQSQQLDLPFNGADGSAPSIITPPGGAPRLRSERNTEQSRFREGINQRLQEMAESGTAVHPLDAYTRELMTPDQISALAETGRLPSRAESMKGAHEAHHTAPKAEWPENRLNSDLGISLPHETHMFDPDFHGNPSTTDMPPELEGMHGGQVIDTDVNRPTPSTDAQIRSQYRHRYPQLFEPGGPLAPTIPAPPGTQLILPGVNMTQTNLQSSGSTTSGEQLSLPFYQSQQLDLPFGRNTTPPSNSSGGTPPSGPGTPPPAMQEPTMPSASVPQFEGMPQTSPSASASQTPNRSSIPASLANNTATPSVLGANTPSTTELQSYNMATRATRMGLEEQQVQPQTLGIASQIGQLFLPQFFGSGGKAPAQQQREDSHRARFASDAQAGNTDVERVNPEYPAPPGTPQQLQAIQQEIENLFVARAQAERAESEMARQQSTLEADQTPIQQAVDGVDGGISAVQAHQEAITRRNQVNQEQQQRQQETGGLVSGYPSQAAGLATLTIPLDVFAGFTSLASHLPGDAGAAMTEMNQDARQIQGAFDQMAVSMVSQDEAQPERQAELTDQQSRIESTDTEAVTSSQSVEQSKQDALNLQQDNETQLAGARQAREQASQQGQTIDQAATTKQAQADSLAEQLQAWAQLHKESRRLAVEETARQLEVEGYIVLEKKEG